MLEGFLAAYKVNNSGGMKRIGEVDIKMGRKFFPSKNGNMTLTRSYDKKLISLANFDKKARATTKNDEEVDEKKNVPEYFKIKAWTSKLEAYYYGLSEEEFEKTDQRLHEEINYYYHKNCKTFDELVSVTFANRSNWIELVYIERKSRSEEEMQGYEEDIIDK